MTDSALLRKPDCLRRLANAASVALLERLGIWREGHLRESTWAKGEWTDDLVYALLRDEWQSGWR